jgi:hypothetical protein
MIGLHTIICAKGPNCIAENGKLWVAGLKGYSCHGHAVGGCRPVRSPIAVNRPSPSRLRPRTPNSYEEGEDSISIEAEPPDSGACKVAAKPAWPRSTFSFVRKARLLIEARRICHPPCPTPAPYKSTTCFRLGVFLIKPRIQGRGRPKQRGCHAVVAWRPR